MATRKIQWLSILQGWAMLLVVVGHVNMYELMMGGSGSDYDWLHKFAYAFHMPLFMFVSGGLFYLTRIQKNWAAKDVYIDKAKRLLVPYIAFTTFCYLLKASLSSHMKRGVSFTWHGFIFSYLDPANGPLLEMWFIGTLFWLMLFYPIYQIAMKKWWGEILLISSAICLFFLPIDLSQIFGGVNLLNVNGINTYALYFVGGMLCFKYQAERWFNKSWMLILLAIAFVAIYLLCGEVVPYIPIIGIAFSIALAQWLDKIAPQIFGSFRNYTFQIFLIGIYPQMFVEIFLWKKFPEIWLMPILYLLSIILALYVSVYVSKLVEKCPWSWVRMSIGLK